MENEINEKLEEIFHDLERSLPRKNAQVVRGVDSTRITIADILDKHAGSDGVIPRNRTNAVMRDLERLDNEIYRELRNELRSVIEATARDTTIGLSEAVIAAIGLLLLIEVGGLPLALADLTEGVTEAVFSALTGSDYRKYIGSAVTSTFNRREDDGKNLTDRLRVLATDIRKSVETDVRKSIQTGENMSGITRKVRRSYTGLRWRISSLVETELMYVMRQAVAKFAEVTPLVRALEIVDFPHGSPGEHEKHRCYIYARADEHGLGAGIYPVGTRKIRNPHPRCRSALFFVMVDRLK